MSDDTSDPLGWAQVLVRSLQQMLAVIIFVRVAWAVQTIGVVFYVLLVLVSAVVAVSVAFSVFSLLNHQHTILDSLHDISHPFGAASSLVLSVSACLASSLFSLSIAETVSVVLVRLSVTKNPLHHTLFERILAVVLLLLTGVSLLIRHGRGSAVRIFLFILSVIGSTAYVLELLISSEMDSEEPPSLFVSPSPVSSLSLVFGVIFPSATGIVFTAAQRLTANTSYLRGSLIASAFACLLYVLAGIGSFMTYEDEETAKNTTTDVYNLLTPSAPFPIWIALFGGGLCAAHSTLQFASITLRDCMHSLPVPEALKSITGSIVIVSTAAILAAGIIGSVNTVAQLTTVFYLSAYTLIGYAAYSYQTGNGAPRLQSLRSLLSIFLTGGLCVAAGYLTVLLPVAVFGILYAYLNSNRNTGKAAPTTIPSCSVYSNTMGGLHQLQSSGALQKQFRPQLLVLTGNPAARPALVDFAHNITRGQSLMICGYVLPQIPTDKTHLLMEKIDKQMIEWLRRREVAAFGSTVVSESQTEGAITLLQTCGLGPVRPNILLLGFKTNWEKGGTDNMAAINGYYHLVLSTFEKAVGLAIFRNSNAGFDVSDIMDTDSEPDNSPSATTSKEPPQRKLTLVNSLKSVTSILKKHNKVADMEQGNASKQPKNRFEVMSKHSVISGPTTNRNLAAQLYRFRTRIHRGTIDVWWLKDCGGLTLLLPHLISLHGSYLEGARLRIFTRCSGSATHVDKDQKNMASLLRRFHIDCTDLHVLTDFDKPPARETVQEFESLIAPFRGENKTQGLITEDQLFSHREKTRRCLRVGELMREHSSGVDLISVTLPQPRRTLPGALYLAWLEMMTRGLPPALINRGNGQSVASYYL